MNYRIGVDVGGTNTDAIIIDNNNKIISKTKTFTTHDIISGISTAISKVVSQSKVNTDSISHAMLGTTQCTNAIVERQKLNKVISIRLAGNATRAITQYCDWPADIKDIINEETYIITGGYEYNGLPIDDINEDEIVSIVKKHKGTCHNYAISCVFSPVNSAQEIKVREIILNEDPEAVISISSEIGSLNLLERENATILNTALNEVIKNVVIGFEQALKENSISSASIYLCQNDGTLMDSSYALKFPVLTIASGPTNSIRGGIYLTSNTDGIIMDVGGTTSDIGVIVNGFPRETSIESEVGGVSTNFRMPDIVSIAVGGGTIVEEIDGEIKVGPKSVGYNLSKEALVFGGDTITLSDIAIKLGYANFGDSSKLSSITEEFANKVMDIVKLKIEDAIDLVRISNENSNLIIVGGGSIVVPKSYNNVLDVLEPADQDVANAIGASIAKVSGECEGIVSFANTSRNDAIENSKKVAEANAIAAGAKKDSLEIVEIDEIPIAYHPEDAVILRVKVVGELAY